ncbi:MAG: ester cyclase [Bacteroidales bacterium]|nr:ester cyclase [Bacteroidales bacterium]
MNKQIIIQEAAKMLFEQGNTDIIDNFFSDTYTAHTGLKTYNGIAFIKQYIIQIRKVIPDIKILKIEFLSLSDNIVTWQRTFCGTHKAKIKGIPPTMKKVRWYEIVVTKFEDEKIIEEWLASDFAFQLMLKRKK